MALTDSFPGPNGLTDSIEAGKDLAGLIAQNPDGTPRAGILAKGPGGLLSGRSDLRVDIAPFKAALVRNGAVRLIANDAGAQSPTFTVPTANSRIDIVYVRVNETLQGDASDGPVFGILQGTAASIPLKPTLNIDGALELGTVRLSSGNTGTAAAPIEQTAPYTAASGGPGGVQHFTSNEGLNDDSSGPQYPSFSTDNALSTDTTLATWLRPTGGGVSTDGVLRFPRPGRYSIQWSELLAATVSRRAFVQLGSDDSTFMQRSSVPQGEDRLSVSIPVLHVTTPNTDVQVKVYKSNGTVGASGRIIVTRLA